MKPVYTLVSYSGFSGVGSTEREGNKKVILT